MSFQLVVSPFATADVIEAAAFIGRDSIENALRLFDAADATFERIAQAPLTWPTYDDQHPRFRGIRRCHLLGFKNCSVYYRVEADTVYVLRVAHDARDLPRVLDEPSSD